MKWEYWKAELPSREKEVISYLDKFGNEGWELVSVDDGTLYFKRPLDNSKSKITQFSGHYSATILDNGYIIYDSYTLRNLSASEVVELLLNKAND